jgi:hypothetical protein
MIPKNMRKAAIFDDSRTWRYGLGRYWDHGEGALMVIGLNPSTADETIEDPTVRRCIDFAEMWGFERLTMTSIFAYRATDPRDMMRANHDGVDVIGPRNDEMLVLSAKNSDLVLAAWGNHGMFLGRDQQVRKLLIDVPLFCLGTTKIGQPLHPLYLRKTAVVREFNEAAAIYGREK